MTPQTPEEFRELKERLFPVMISSLQRRGAPAALASDIVSDVFGDCVLEGEQSLLSKYKEGSSLDAWLIRVAINRLIDTQRRAKFRDESGPERLDSLRSPVPSFRDPDWEQLVIEALNYAYSQCSPEDRVLLWMVHAMKINQKFLCRSWNYSASKMSRRLASIRESFRTMTLSYIRSREPDLSLGWPDILSLCIEQKLPLFPEPEAKNA